MCKSVFSSIEGKRAGEAEMGGIGFQESTQPSMGEVMIEEG